MTFRPMLAAKAPKLDQLQYPLLASAKLDGIRATMVAGKLMSRTMKLIPNRAVQAYFQQMPQLLQGMDGELLVGAHDNDVYRRTVSAVMSRDGDPMPDLVWWIFDHVNMGGQFSKRIADIAHLLHGPVKGTAFKVLQHVEVNSPEDVLAHHEAAILNGHEGLVLRSPHGEYKNGRSTLSEQGMVKVKMFNDSEALVLGVVELMHNDNEATVSELGLTKRSSHQVNKRASGMLGALRVRDIHTDVEFEIGTGFTEADRQSYWFESPVGRIAKYKYFAYGVKDKPRHPVFLGWRDPIDV